MVNNADGSWSVIGYGASRAPPVKIFSHVINYVNRRFHFKYSLWDCKNSLRPNDSKCPDKSGTKLLESKLNL